jgi:hypothetical protein
MQAGAGFADPVFRRVARTGRRRAMLRVALVCRATCRAWRAGADDWLMHDLLGTADGAQRVLRGVARSGDPCAAVDWLRRLAPERARGRLGRRGRRAVAEVMAVALRTGRLDVGEWLVRYAGAGAGSVRNALCTSPRAIEWCFQRFPLTARDVLASRLLVRLVEEATAASLEVAAWLVDRFGPDQLMRHHICGCWSDPTGATCALSADRIRPAVLAWLEETYGVPRRACDVRPTDPWSISHLAVAHQRREQHRLRWGAAMRIAQHCASAWS